MFGDGDDDDRYDDDVHVDHHDSMNGADDHLLCVFAPVKVSVFFCFCSPHFEVEKLVLAYYEFVQQQQLPMDHTVLELLTECLTIRLMAYAAELG